MDEKRCGRCGLTKSVDQYGKNRAKSDGFQASCKPCVKIINQTHYATSKLVQNPKRAATRERAVEAARILIWDWLEKHPCVDCDERDILVLQFDHVRGQKFKDISVMMFSGYGVAKIQTEIEKCDVRCANCHARKTASQFGWSKLALVAQRQSTPLLTEVSGFRNSPGVRKTPSRHQ